MIQLRLKIERQIFPMQVSIGELDSDTPLSNFISILCEKTATEHGQLPLRFFFGGKELINQEGLTVSNLGIRSDSIVYATPVSPAISSDNEGQSPFGLETSGQEQQTRSPPLQSRFRLLFQLVELFPQCCTEHGGVAVQIRGDGFIQGNHVICKFGSILVPGKVVSPNIIITQAPAHPPGLAFMSCISGSLVEWEWIYT